MSLLTQIIFHLSIIAVLYVYIGYPVALAVWTVVKKRPVRGQDITPAVTVLIAAYNEAGGIAETVRNKLEQDYPSEKLEIIVVSDGSTDGTDAIVAGFQDRGVLLLRQEPRSGKTAALNMAVAHAGGEILLFSDANSHYAPDAIRKLVRNFGDPAVGYVTGKMVYTHPDGTMVGDGCTAYMKYENLLRTLETHAGSVVGVDGGIDAVRKVLYQPMRADQLPDFVLPLAVAGQGYRVVYEPEAMLKEPALNDAVDEYRMRVRVSLRAFWALYDMRRLLKFKPDPVFAWQLWSHKVLRYLCFVFLLLAWGSNLLLWQNGNYYRLLFVLQNLVYLGALTAPLVAQKAMARRWLDYMRYFVLLNLAAGHAFIKFLTGKKQVLWTPRKG